MPCNQSQLNALADGELGRWAAARVRRHLKMCPACAEEYRIINKLGVQARAWRDVKAPAGLEARIADILTHASRLEDTPMTHTHLLTPPLTRPRPRWQVSAALVTTVVGLAGALFWLPGSLLRPSPAFASVQRAMGTPRFLSWTETQITRGRDGRVQLRDVRHVWVRRNPPAIAAFHEPTFALGPQRTLRDARGKITLKLNTGEYIRDARPGRDIRGRVVDTIRELTEPPVNTGLLAAPGVQATAWRLQTTTLDGRAVWQFTRQVRAAIPAPTLPLRRLDVISAQTVWADSKTRRVVRSQTRDVINGMPAIEEVKTEFQYDEAPPVGTFDLVPPHEAKELRPHA